MRRRGTDIVPPPRLFESEEEKAKERKRKADVQKAEYKRMGKEYATPPPKNALPEPAQATAGDIRDRDMRSGNWRGVRNASERYRMGTAHWMANGCMYRGKNTADGRCPGCGRRAHPQRSGGKRKK